MLRNVDEFVWTNVLLQIDLEDIELEDVKLKMV